MSQKKNSFFKVFSLYKFLSAKRKKQAILLLLFASFSGLAEMLMVYSIIPFLSIFTNDASENFNIFFFLYDFFYLEKSFSYFYFTCLVFLLIVLIASLCKIFCLLFVGKLSALIGSELGNKAYNRILNLEFVDFMKVDRSSIISDQVYKIHYLIEFILMPFFNIFTNTISLLCIITILFITNPIITLFLTISIGSSYFLVSIFVNKKISRNSQILIKNQESLIKLLRESFSSIRQIILKNLQTFFSVQQNKIDTPMRLAYANNTFLSGFPRYLIELLGIIILVFSAIFFISTPKDSISFVGTLGVFAFGAQRMLPSMQHLYNGFVNMKAYYLSLDRIIFILGEKRKNKKDLNDNLKLKKSIEFKKVKFSYDQDNIKFVKQLNLNFVVGDMIGIEGKTGSGKSTMIDLLLGFLRPISGKILFDGKDINAKRHFNFKECMQNRISHVPHSVFLSNTTIKENIAFGTSPQSLNKKKIDLVAKISQISQKINNMPAAFNSKVGEDGDLLSTGQKQRIGIARALYDDFDILILDEATSSIDVKTESLILNEIKKMFGHESIIIIISHRKNSFKFCNKIINFDKKKIVVS